MKNTITVDGKRLTCRIFDAGDSVADRYTIAFKGFRISNYVMNYPYLASSENPYHPGGVGLHCESRKFLTGKHLGKRVAFDALPPMVQRFILENI